MIGLSSAPTWLCSGACANPHVSTVILGASRLGQLKDNLAALQHKDKLTPDVLEKIEDIMGNKPKAFERY
jgi:aryl-alcohol dehydrogenase-like predicted oxidoreductase